MLIVDISIKPARVQDLRVDDVRDLVAALDDAADILRIDGVGDDRERVYEPLAGRWPTHFTRLGGATR